MSKGMLDGGSKGVSLDDLKTPQVQPTETAGSKTTVVEPTEQTEPANTPAPAPEPTPQEPVVAQETDPTPAPDPTPAEQNQMSGLNLAFLNEMTGKSFTSEDQVKEALAKPTMELEYGELKTKHQDLEEKYNMLTEQLDPTKYFSSDDAMKLELFRRDNPNKDVSVAQKVFSTEDLTSVSDLEIVKMGYKFKAPNLRGDLEETIAEEMNVEPGTPLSEWPVSAQNRLAIRASDFRDQFDSMKKSVTIPERVNIEELHTQRKQTAEAAKAKLENDWRKNSEEVLQSSKKLSIPIGKPKEGEDQQFFEWDLGQAPQEEVSSLTSDYVALGLEMTDETKESFNSSVRLALMEKHLPQIMQKYGDDLIARQKEEFLKTTNNVEPLKDTQRPVVSSDEQVLKERSAFAMGGGSALKRRPMFKPQVK